MSQARRRGLLNAVGVLLFALLGALPTGAQPQPAVVGRLQIGSPADFAARGPDLFIDGLRELGYKDGESIIIETRWAHGDITRYPGLARDLIERRPAVILAPCGPSLRAIREITRTLPVVAIIAVLPINSLTLAP